MPNYGMSSSSGNPWGDAANTYQQGLNQLLQIKMKGQNDLAQAPLNLYDRFMDGYEKARARAMEEEKAKLAREQLDRQNRLVDAQLAKEHALEGFNLMDKFSKEGDPSNYQGFLTLEKQLGHSGIIPPMKTVPGQDYGPDLGTFNLDRPAMGDGEVTVNPLNTDESTGGSLSGSVMTLPTTTRSLEGSIQLTPASVDRKIAPTGSLLQKSRDDAAEKSRAAQAIEIIRARQEAEAERRNVATETLNERRHRETLAQREVDSARASADRRLGYSLANAGREETRSLKTKMEDEKKRQAMLSDEGKLNSLESTMNELKRSAEEIHDHPALSSTLSPLGIVKGLVPKTEEYGVRAKINRITAQAMLSKIEDMKAQTKTGATGMGQLSNQEGAVLRQAIANLDTNQSEEDFKAQLKLIVSHADNAIKRNRDMYEKKYGDSQKEQSDGDKDERTLALEAIKERPNDAEKIKQMYKRKTGKDL